MEEITKEANPHSRSRFERASSFAVLRFLNNLDLDNPIFLKMHMIIPKNLGFLEQIHVALKRL